MGKSESTIYIGADHAGFELKEYIKHYLYGQGFIVVDCGNTVFDKDDDYPDYAFDVARSVVLEPGARGILFCSSGVGMSIAANKIPGIRAAKISVPGQAQVARCHNDSNVLCVGARIATKDMAKEIVDNWLESKFSNAPRHIRRLDKIAKAESEGSVILSKLSHKSKKIIPAVLESTIEDAQEKLRVLVGHTDWVQIDIIDETYNINPTFQISELDGHSWPFLFEAHLMVKNPAEFIPVCEKNGIERIILHQRGRGPKKISQLINQIHCAQMEVGLALDPDEDIESVVEFAMHLDSILVMSVVPGKSGQHFLEDTYDRIIQLRKYVPWSVKIGVDGGIKLGHVGRLKETGANYLCVNSGIFRQASPLTALSDMKKAF